jgi:integrase
LIRRFYPSRGAVYTAILTLMVQTSVKLNFTKRSLDALHAKPKRYSVYDERVSGLGLLVLPSGYKSFFWFRKVHGRPTWKTIGNFSELSIEQARARAQELNVSIADWKSRRYDGANPVGKPNREPTLNEIIEDYCDKRLAGHAKNPERAAKGVRWSRDKYLASFKNRRLSSIERKDVRDLHRSIGKAHGHVTANRVATLLKTLFNWAKKSWEWKGENPAALIEKFPESRRSRVLQGVERKTFVAALADEPNGDLRDFVVLAIFTGARMSDILSMRWKDIAFGTDPVIWTVPTPKNSKPYEVMLMPEALERLTGRKNGSEWVFPSTGKSGHLVTVKKGWQALMKRTGIKGLTIHDLRRTHATMMEEAGVSISVISKILGHSHTGVTEKYIHAGRATLADAVRKGTRLLND